MRSSWDYAQVEKAAALIVKGLSPYGTGTTYVLYPPLYAQAMAGCFSLLSVLLRSAEDVKIWNLLFYLFQNLQFAASLATLWCAFKFSRVCEYTQLQAALISTVVTVFSAPFCETIVGHQVNIFITAIILFGLVYFEIAPAMSGIAVAVGTCLKVYPATLIVTWIWHRQWRPAFFAIGTVAMLVAIQTLAGGGLHVWTDYFSTASSYIGNLPLTPPGWLFTSPGLVTVNYRLWNVLSDFAQLARPSLPTCTSIARIEASVLAIYFVIRCFTIPKSLSRNFVLIERECNLLSLLLLTGPSALTHHYTMAIPIVIWTFKQGFKYAPILTAVSIILMLCPTPLNFFPFALQSLGLLIATGVRQFKPKD
ncbi:MAG: DUF2029 domain-containing protein [Cyanobacteria bacterium SZAS-4]|nr:DUF2029 domain-containing protein [Cyanobacteria bacterium SZAS-4]